MHRDQETNPYPAISQPDIDFPLDFASIQARIEAIDADRYARSRNFLNGGITYLSPYLSRGVISTRQVAEAVLQKTSLGKAYKLIQELAWRDYFQQVWRAQGNAILRDLKQPQQRVSHRKMISAVMQAQCGIEAIDQAVERLYEVGYMHNHVRMYTAMLVSNVGQSHWWTPSLWLYHHLLDHDVASNMLNWQWNAGSFSNKKYYANQENINKYTGSKQRDSYLDVSYEQLAKMDIPDDLAATQDFYPKQQFPDSDPLPTDADKIFVYNSYNLDPHWRSGEDGLRLLLLEPSHFKQFPISEKVMDFVVALGKSNIPQLKIFMGEFAELSKPFPAATFYFKEHPTAMHYQGVCDAREWIAPSVTGYFPSFFGYWKKAEKQVVKQFG